MREEETTRDLALKAKAYRVFALLFACVGFLIFVLLYVVFYQADITVFLSTPSSIFIVLMAFLPALIFSATSSRAEKKLLKKLEDEKKVPPEQPVSPVSEDTSKSTAKGVK